MICTVCTGRGEVEAGITHGTIEYGIEYDAIDWRGNTHKARACYPTGVCVNKNAFDTRYQTIWFLDYNHVVPLWSTAICQGCHGTGEINGLDTSQVG